MIQAVRPDDVVLGGGNAKKLKPAERLPGGQQPYAFIGGFRCGRTRRARRPPARAQVRRAA